MSSLLNTCPESSLRSQPKTTTISAMWPLITTVWLRHDKPYQHPTCPAFLKLGETLNLMKLTSLMLSFMQNFEASEVSSQLCTQPSRFQAYKSSNCNIVHQIMWFPIFQLFPESYDSQLLKPALLDRTLFNIFKYPHIWSSHQLYKPGSSNFHLDKSKLIQTFPFTTFE